MTTQEKFLWISDYGSKPDFDNPIVDTETDFIKYLEDNSSEGENWTKFKLTNLGKFEVKIDYKLVKKEVKVKTK